MAIRQILRVKYSQFTHDSGQPSSNATELISNAPSSIHKEKLSISPSKIYINQSIMKTCKGKCTKEHLLCEARFFTFFIWLLFTIIFFMPKLKILPHLFVTTMIWSTQLQSRLVNNWRKGSLMLEYTMEEWNMRSFVFTFFIDVRIVFGFQAQNFCYWLILINAISPCFYTYFDIYNLSAILTFIF